MTRRAAELQRLLEGFHALRRCLGSHTKGGAAALSITGAQWLALHAIAEHAGMSVKDLSEELGISSSAATQLVRGLAKSGYVRRSSNPSDARATRIELAPKTRATLAGIRRSAFARMEKLCAALSDRELAQYVALHEKLVRACVPSSP